MAIVDGYKSTKSGWVLISRMSLILSPVLGYAQTAAQNPETTQIGRYQMISHPSGGLYLLDTSTGQVWKSTLKDNFYYHDVWELQIANPPERF